MLRKVRERVIQEKHKQESLGTDHPNRTTKRTSRGGVCLPVWARAVPTKSLQPFRDRNLQHSHIVKKSKPLARNFKSEVNACSMSNNLLIVIGAGIYPALK